MAHSALLPVSVMPSSAAGWSLEGRSGWRPLEPAKKLFRRLNDLMAPGYRPERHYMRGGRTAGSKSLATATAG